MFTYIRRGEMYVCSASEYCEEVRLVVKFTGGYNWVVWCFVSWCEQANNPRVQEIFHRVSAMTILAHVTSMVLARSMSYTAMLSCCDMTAMTAARVVARGSTRLLGGPLPESYFWQP